MRHMGHDDVGSRIRLRRQELRMTQEELAERLDVHTATVRAWELNRHYPTRHQGALEAELGIRLDGGEGDIDPTEQKLRTAGLPPATLKLLLAAYRGSGEAMARTA